MMLELPGSPLLQIKLLFVHLIVEEGGGMVDVTMPTLMVITVGMEQ